MKTKNLEQELAEKAVEMANAVEMAAAIQKPMKPIMNEEDIYSQENCTHEFQYSGKLPCTGFLLCRICGKEANTLPNMWKRSKLNKTKRSRQT